MTERVYLDWNATAPLRPEARQAMLDALACAGNPSSVHAEGRAARAIVERARQSIAQLAGSGAGGVVFTSGGTEANALALASELDGRRFDRLLVSAVEHPSVLAGGRFLSDAVERISVDGEGRVDLAALTARLAVLAGNGQRALVSIMAANNETGVLQPVMEAARIVHEAGAMLHVDAVQAFGRIPLSFSALNVDMMTVSAHKIGGPKGVGALILRPGLRPFPLMTGGGQEQGRRAGTENVAGIAGFGAAAAACARDMAAQAVRLAALRAKLEDAVRAATPDVVIFGASAERIANTTLLGRPGMRAETAVIAFDLEGIAVSSGAACSSGKVQPSHVLSAMGIVPDLARGAIRVSMGPDTTESDVIRFLEAWKKVSEYITRAKPELAA
ncbi:MAG TPA: cysteine desulfurase family protein [Xanthobacteraceae bacterium]|nr:cysteine desulfurase family protein [Xanthobacteraceae bacterium]